MRKGRALGGAESGETLVEILMTIVIVGVSFVAILGAIFTLLRVSDYHAKTSTADVIVRNFAETMKQAGGTAAYIPCTTAGSEVTYPPAAWASTIAKYPHYSADITNIRYISAYSATGQPTWQDTCPATDLGAQELTLFVSGPNNDPKVRGRETILIIKRDAACEAANPPDRCSGTVTP